MGYIYFLVQATDENLNEINSCAVGEADQQTWKEDNTEMVCMILDTITPIPSCFDNTTQLTHTEAVEKVNSQTWNEI